MTTPPSISDADISYYTDFLFDAAYRLFLLDLLFEHNPNKRLFWELYSQEEPLTEEQVLALGDIVKGWLEAAKQAGLI